MNKLILVGNGFDLAHGLPTSYKDFLNDFWKNLSKNYKNQNLINIDEEFDSFFNYGGNEIENLNDLMLNLKGYCIEYHYNFLPENYMASYEARIIFGFENNFFKKICVKNSIQNWVDIENEYYKQVKNILRTKYSNTVTEEKRIEANKNRILKLNEEFEEVKNLLCHYLKNNIINGYDFNMTLKSSDIGLFSKYLQMSYYSEDGDYRKDLPYEKDWKELSSRIRKSERGVNDKEREIILLNFNYTPTLSYYLNKFKTYEHKEIKIHGNLDNMIFGFGDETDDDYQLIENINDNEYLKNFKSFQYSSNSNYNDFFTFLDSDKFHIYIMGHSCGLSDRVLLNNIFEHKNCRGIKIFYHQKEDGSDNYLDIVHNISRHFQDKQSMRRKIVNKEYSVPLPQTVRFQKR